MRHNFSIDTDRLKLRPLVREDLDRVFGWRNKAEIRNSFFNNDIITWKQHLSWFAAYLNNERDIVFMIEETADIHEVVGMGALSNIDTDKQMAEFGRLMIGNSKARGKGIGLESVTAICDFGFLEMGLKEIYLEVFEHNSASVNIYQKAGFGLTGTRASDRGTVLVMTLSRGDSHCG
ncbi:GNAT family N-acetyltransferase [Paenibacillus beijingensis]|uniref:GNAT family N-acetyltransferase n=1 Tax=Paenibacillus beijingensis TaxID=1126833 RepID=UPI0006966A61|nr:GNAT family N-acetyltransferase [Paenibacillus beijingensis]